MKYAHLYRDLLNQLKKRIPQNTELVKKIMNILPLEKDAVYRRLRQEVPFSFEEIAIIAKEFNISLDIMLGVITRTAFPFDYQSADNDHIVEMDYLPIDEYKQAIKEAASDSKGEISMVTNMIPFSFYKGFNFISKFYYFMWLYYTLPANHGLFYHEIRIPDRLIQICQELFTHSKNVNNSSIILNKSIFQDFINDVTYFNNIRLIRDEDIKNIKDELFQYLDFMEFVAVKGFVENPSNLVKIYISDTSIAASYSFIDLEFAARLVLFYSIFHNNMLSLNEKSLDRMRYQIRSKIRTSTLISITGEKQRTQYFEKQRKKIELL